MAAVLVEGNPSLSVTIHVDNSRTYTTAIVQDGGATGIGTAKRHPGDEVNGEIGARIATARALADLAEAQLAAVDREMHDGEEENVNAAECGPDCFCKRGD